jgi:hypothetical protein
LKYLIAYTNMPMCFYTIVLMPFGAWKGQKVFIFLPWSFFFVNFFDHITKDASILHLKLSGSYRLSYFPTSTPSKHTSHHHGRSIASSWFLTYKYDRPTTGSWLWAWKDFDTYFKPTWRPFTSPFSLILFLCTFL